MAINFASALLWKWVAVAVFYVGSVVGAYHYGAYNERLDQAEQRAVAAEEMAEQIADNVAARLPQVQDRDTEAANLRAQLNTIKGKLDAAINQNPSNPECALSDDELRYFRELTASATGT